MWWRSVAVQVHQSGTEVPDVVNDSSTVTTVVECLPGVRVHPLQGSCLPSTCHIPRLWLPRPVASAPANHPHSSPSTNANAKLMTPTTTTAPP